MFLVLAMVGLLFKWSTDTIFVFIILHLIFRDTKIEIEKIKKNDVEQDDDLATDTV